MKFKGFIFAVMLAAAVSASAQSNVNRIYRNCSGTTTRAQVSIDVAGNVTVNPCSGKTVTIGTVILLPVASLTDNGSTIATNAALGNSFRTTALTANVTLSSPTNPSDGQVVSWEIVQNASAAKTLAFGAAFGFGAELTGCTISTTLSSHNFITAIYNSTASKWYVRGCLTGY